MHLNKIFLSLVLSVSFLTLNAQSGKVGIGTNNPQNTLEVNGWLQISGNQFYSGGNANNGAMRYNTSKSCIELYEGGAWNCLITAANSLADHDFYKVGTTTAPDNINDNSFTMGKTGFGINNPVAGIHQVSDYGFVSVDGPGAASMTAPSGDGYRMVWQPQNGSFRAGRVIGTNWDPSNLAIHSAAFNFSTLATGNSAFACGYETRATGTAAFAANYRTEASGAHSAAFNTSTTASGNFSAAFGNLTDAIGLYSFAQGQSSEAPGETSVALNHNTNASGDFSVAMNYSSESSGRYSVAMGRSTIASGDHSVAMGFTTEARGIYSFAGGNSDTGNNADYAFAMGLACNANGEASIAMGRSSTANGTNAVAIGYYANASGTYSSAFGQSSSAGDWAFAAGNNSQAQMQGCVAIGWQNQATQNYATAIGYSCNATATKSTAIGDNAQATGTNAVAIGTNANANYTNAVSLGETAWSNAYGSAALGFGTWASSMGECALGTYNTNYTPFGGQSGFDANDRILSVGNGTQPSRSDAFIIYKSGDATLNGTLTQTSDKRLKTNIQKLDSPIENLKKLNGYQYYWKDQAKRGDKLQYGVIAQEVAELYPDMVRKNGNDELTVSYSSLIPVLIEATKNQQVVIEQQQAAIEQLMQRIDAIENQTTASK